MTDQPRSGLPILGQLSMLARIFLIGTVVLSIAAIVLDFGLHADATVLFIVSAAAILGSGVGRRPVHGAARVADRPAGRRHPQRDVRQHRRADHRVLRPPGRPDRGRQGVADRLDHRQPAAGHGRQRPDRRPAPRHPDVQLEARRPNAALLALALIGLFVPAIFALTTSDATVGSITEESVLVSVVLIFGYVLSLIFQFTHPDATLGGHGEPEGHAGPAWSGTGGDRRPARRRRAARRPVRDPRQLHRAVHRRRSGCRRSSSAS